MDEINTSEPGDPKSNIMSPLLRAIEDQISDVVHQSDELSQSAPVIPIEQPSPELPIDIVQQQPVDIVDTLPVVLDIPKQGIDSPFPNHLGYTKLHNSLSPSGQTFLFNNVHVSSDNKIEILGMKIKISLLLPSSLVSEGVYDGSYVDPNGQTGFAGITYYTSTGSILTINRKQRKQDALRSKDDIDSLLSHLPGANEEAKIMSLVTLLELPKAGSLDDLRGTWFQIGTVGYLRISRVFDGLPNYSFRIFFNDTNAGMDFAWDVYASPTLIYENIDETKSLY